MKSTIILIKLPNFEMCVDVSIETACEYFKYVYTYVLYMHIHIYIH